MSITERYAEWLFDGDHTRVSGYVAYALQWLHKIGMQTIDAVAERPYRSTLAAQSGQLYYLQARGLLRSGKIAEAGRLLELARTQAPLSLDALECYGELLEMTGQVALAATMYDEQRRIQSSLRTATPDRSFVLRRVGRFTNEVAAYTTALRHVGNHAFPFIALGNAYLAQRQPRRALANYAVALNCQRGDAQVLALKGEALSMLGEHEKAIQSFDAALSRRPGDADALGGRAIALLAGGRLSEADTDWRAQFELLPRERAAARACIALRLAEYAVAVPELERAHARAPHDPYWRLYLLASLCRLGRPAGDLVTVADGGSREAWPGPLLALYAGRMSAGDVLARAHNLGRRSEALFHLGILALERDPGEARCLWRQLVEQFQPDLIEHAAAQHELALLGRG